MSRASKWDRRSLRFRSLGAAAVFCFPWGCSRSSSTNPSDSGISTGPRDAETLGTTPATNRAPGVSDAGSKRLRPPCRILSAVGKESAARIGNTLEREKVVSLDSGSNMVARDVESGREFRLSGPGEFYPCLTDGDTARVLSGTFESLPYAAEGPGPEMWLATPHGVLRFQGPIRVEVAQDRTKFTAVHSEAYAWTPGATGPWRSLHGESYLTGEKGAVTLAACERSAEQARARAALLLADAAVREDGGTARLAVEHLLLRRDARAACLMARTVGLSGRTMPEDWQERISAAETAYRQL